MLFFFSSRRRHTRFDCDWSSDVCSSDLVWNTMRAHQWLDRFCHISPRDQIFSVLLNQWEAQPTSRAIDHCLPAAAYKFQGVLDGIELAFLTCSGDAGGKSIKPGNIIDAQVIVAAYFNDLPIAGSEC